jgi:WD40 repeat protein
VALLVSGIFLSLLLGLVVSLNFMFDALAAKETADRERTNTRREINKLYVAKGLELADRGDLYSALLWFALPFQDETQSPLDQDIHLQRLSNYWRYTPKPTLVQFHVCPEDVRDPAFSPDGRRVAFLRSGALQVWDLVTGKSISLPSRGPRIELRVIIDSRSVFSPDSRRVLTIFDKTTVRVWDAATGQPLSPPLLHKAEVSYASFSPDGQRVVTTCAKTARVWDVVTGREFIPPLMHQADVATAVFSLDGHSILTTSANAARVWDAATGRQLSPPLLHKLARGFFQPLPVNASLSPNGQRVVTWSSDVFGGEESDVTPQVWDTTTGRPLYPPLLHKGIVFHAEFSPNGKRLITASLRPDERVGESTIRVWDANTGRPLADAPHMAPMFAKLSWDGRHFLSQSVDGSARVWHSATGADLSPFLSSPRSLDLTIDTDTASLATSFSADARRILMAQQDGTVRVWDLAGNAESQTVVLKHIDNNQVYDAWFSPDSRRVLTRGFSGIQVSDALTGRPLLAALSHSAPWRPSFNSTGGIVLTCPDRITVRARDANTGKRVGHPMIDNAEVLQAWFTRDDQSIETVTKDGLMRVWDVNSGKMVRTMHLLDGSTSIVLVTISIDQDGERVLAVDQKGTAHLWDATTGRPIGLPLGSESDVTSASLSRGGKRVATTSKDGIARVWDVGTGRLLFSSPRGQDKARYASFSPDGEQILVGPTARIWAIATGQPLTIPLRQHQGAPLPTFSPDGRFVVTIGFDGARVWEVATGQPLTPPLRGIGVTTHASFSPDGQYLVTRDKDKTVQNTVQVWNIGADNHSAEDWLLLTRFLVGRMDRLGGVQRMSPQDLKSAWETLKAKYPNDFTVTPEQAIAWHRREAEQCLKEGNGPAYLFHAWHAQWEGHVLFGSPFLRK